MAWKKPQLVNCMVQTHHARYKRRACGSLQLLPHGCFGLALAEALETAETAIEGQLLHLLIPEINT